MDILELKDLQENNAAWILLRKSNAAYILSFLMEAFKTRSRTEIPSDQLVVELTAFQEHLIDNNVDALKGTSESVLSAWASDAEQILWRSHDNETDTYVFTLRASTEEAIQFVTSLQEARRPVAAETSLKRIFAVMEEVVLMGHGDVKTYISRLEVKRDALQRDIDRIAANGIYEKNPHTIREYYRNIIDDIRALGGDFRKVEEDFREVAKDIQNSSIGDSATRGDVLEYILDHDDYIRKSDQGQSFFGFLALLNSPEQLIKLDALRDDLAEIPELASFDMAEIMTFERRLLQEAQRVNKTVQKLSRQLRRVLDDKANAERQKLLAQIQSIVAHFAEEDFTLESPEEFIVVEDIPRFQMIDDLRPFRPPAKLQEQAAIVYKETEAERNAAAESLADLERIDYEALEANIHQCFELLGKTSVTLPEIINKKPLKHGLIELAGYLQIAHDHGCHFVGGKTDSIEVPGLTNDLIRLSFPRVLLESFNFTTDNIAHNELA